MTDRERTQLAQMSEAEIRRCQDLVRAQQRMAYEQRNTRALERLAEWEDGYAEEMLRRLS